MEEVTHDVANSSAIEQGGEPALPKPAQALWRPQTGLGSEFPRMSPGTPWVESELEKNRAERLKTNARLVESSQQIVELEQAVRQLVQMQEDGNRQARRWFPPRVFVHGLVGGAVVAGVLSVWAISFVQPALEAQAVALRAESEATEKNERLEAEVMLERFNSTLSRARLERQDAQLGQASRAKETAEHMLVQARKGFITNMMAFASEKSESGQTNDETNDEAALPPRECDVSRTNEQVAPSIAAGVDGAAAEGWMLEGCTRTSPPVRATIKRGLGVRGSDAWHWRENVTGGEIDCYCVPPKQ